MQSNQYQAKVFNPKAHYKRGYSDYQRSERQTLLLIAAAAIGLGFFMLAGFFDAQNYDLYLQMTQGGK